MGQGPAPGPSMGETAKEGLEIMCICLCASVWNDALVLLPCCVSVVGVVQQGVPIKYILNCINHLYNV